MPRILALLLMGVVALPATSQPASAAPAAVKSAMKVIRLDAVRAHVKFLSSDLLEGRGPGTRGDAIATQYLASQFEMMGLAPAGDNGTYFQKVSLLGLSYDPAKSSVSLVGNDRPTMGPLTYLDQFVGMDQ